MDVYVARQPIFDRKKNIAAYELLFRDSMSNAFPEIDGDVATSKLLTRSFFNIGLDQLTGGKKAFINFTEDLLLKQVPTMFPREEVVVEVLEDVTPGDAVIRACEQIMQQGYVLALDDFIYRDDLTELISLADIIKIDFMLTPQEAVGDMLSRLSQYEVEFLAEKIETYEEYQADREMGFKYFQGYFFSKPEILKSTDIAPSHVGLLQLVAELNREDCSMAKLEEMVNVDISISYKLLRYINSAYFRRVREITSIRQFVMLVTAAELAGDKPNELIRASIIRAKFCQLMGQATGEGVDPAELFLVGLFSMLDAMLDAPMDAIVEQLPFSEGVKTALVARKGALADYLNLVTAYEIGDWDKCRELSVVVALSEEALPASYLDAVGWADAYPVL